MHKGTQVSAGGPGRRRVGVRTLRRQLWSAKAWGDMDCRRALFFLDFIFFLLESAAQALQSQLPSVYGLFLILWPACHTAPSSSLLFAWASYPAHRAKKEGGKEREEKWCHTAMMSEHCLDGGEVEGVWVQRKR